MSAFVFFYFFLFFTYHCIIILQYCNMWGTFHVCVYIYGFVPCKYHFDWFIFYYLMWLSGGLNPHLPRLVKTGQQLNYWHTQLQSQCFQLMESLLQKLLIEGSCDRWILRMLCGVIFGLNVLFPSSILSNVLSYSFSILPPKNQHISSMNYAIRWLHLEWIN